MSELLQFPGSKRPIDSGNGTGNGRDVERRLRAVEGDVREIKTLMRSVATKSDVKELADRLKIWILSSTITALVLVIGYLVTWIIRLVTGSGPADP